MPVNPTRPRSNAVALPAAPPVLAPENPAPNVKTQATVPRVVPYQHAAQQKAPQTAQGLAYKPGGVKYELDTKHDSPQRDAQEDDLRSTFAVLTTMELERHLDQLRGNDAGTMKSRALICTELEARAKRRTDPVNYALRHFPAPPTSAK